MYHNVFVERSTNSRVFGLLIPRIQSRKPAGVGNRSGVDICANPGLQLIRQARGDPKGYSKVT